jgi:hypothetical protein
MGDDALRANCCGNTRATTEDLTRYRHVAAKPVSAGRTSGNFASSEQPLSEDWPSVSIKIPPLTACAEHVI